MLTEGLLDSFQFNMPNYRSGSRMESYLSVPVVSHEETSGDRLPFNSGRQSRIGMVPEKEVSYDQSDEENGDGNVTLLTFPTAHALEISDASKDGQIDEPSAHNTEGGEAERFNFSLNICCDETATTNASKNDIVNENGNGKTDGSSKPHSCQESSNETNLLNEHSNTTNSTADDSANTHDNPAKHKNHEVATIKSDCEQSKAEHKRHANYIENLAAKQDEKGKEKDIGSVGSVKAGGSGDRNGTDSDDDDTSDDSCGKDDDDENNDDAGDDEYNSDSFTEDILTDDNGTVDKKRPSSTSPSLLSQQSSSSLSLSVQGSDRGNETESEGSEEESETFSSQNSTKRKSDDSDNSDEDNDNEDEGSVISLKQLVSSPSQEYTDDFDTITSDILIKRDATSDAIVGECNRDLPEKTQSVSTPYIRRTLGKDEPRVLSRISSRSVESSYSKISAESRTSKILETNSSTKLVVDQEITESGGVPFQSLGKISLSNSRQSSNDFDKSSRPTSVTSKRSIESCKSENINDQTKEKEDIKNTERQSSCISKTSNRSFERRDSTLSGSSGKTGHLTSRTESSLSESTIYSYSSYRSSSPSGSEASDRSSSVMSETSEKSKSRTSSRSRMSQSSYTDSVSSVDRARSATSQKSFSSVNLSRKTSRQNHRISVSSRKSSGNKDATQKSPLHRKSVEQKNLPTTVEKGSVKETRRNQGDQLETTANPEMQKVLKTESNASFSSTSIGSVTTTLSKRSRTNNPRSPRKPPHKYKPNSAILPSMKNEIRRVPKTPSAETDGEYIASFAKPLESRELRKDLETDHVIKTETDSLQKSSNERPTGYLISPLKRKDDAISEAKTSAALQRKHRSSENSHYSTSRKSSTDSREFPPLHHRSYKRQTTDSPSSGKLLSSRQSMLSRNASSLSTTSIQIQQKNAERRFSRTSIASLKDATSDCDSAFERKSTNGVRESFAKHNRKDKTENRQVEREFSVSPTDSREEIVVNKYDSNSLESASSYSEDSTGNSGEKLGVSARNLLEQMLKDDEGNKRQIMEEGKPTVSQKSNTTVTPRSHLLKSSTEFGSGSLIADDTVSDKLITSEENKCVPISSGKEGNDITSDILDTQTDDNESVLLPECEPDAVDNTGSLGNDPVNAQSDGKMATGNEEHPLDSSEKLQRNMNDSNRPINMITENGNIVSADDTPASCWEGRVEIQRYRKMEKRATYSDVYKQTCHPSVARVNKSAADLVNPGSTDHWSSGKLKSDKDKQQKSFSLSEKSVTSIDSRQASVETVSQDTDTRSHSSSRPGSSRSLISRRDSTRSGLSRRNTSSNLTSTQHGDVIITDAESPQKDRIHARLRRADFGSANSILVDRDGNPADLNTSRVRLRDIRRQLKLSNDQLVPDTGVDNKISSQRYFRAVSSPSALSSPRDLSSVVVDSILSDIISKICHFKPQESLDCAHRCRARDASGETVLCCLLPSMSFDETSISCDIVNPLDLMPVTRKYETLLTHILQLSSMEQEQFTNEREVGVIIPVNTSCMTSWQEPVVRELGADGKWKDIPGYCQIHQRSIDSKIVPTVEVVIRDSQTLAVVARPKKDDFIIGDSSVRGTSSVDDRVVMHVPVSQDCGSKDMSLQVIPVDGKMVNDYNDHCRSEDGERSLLASSPLIMIQVQDKTAETFNFTVPCMSANQRPDSRLLPITYSLNLLSPGSSGSGHFLRPYTAESGRSRSTSPRPLSRASLSPLLIPSPTRLSLGGRSFTEDRQDTDRHLIQLTRGSGMRVKLLSNHDNAVDDNSDDREDEVLSFTIHDKSTSFVALETKKGMRYSELEHLAESFADYIAQKLVKIQVYQTITDIYTINFRVGLKKKASRKESMIEHPAYYRYSERELLLEEGDTITVHLKGNIKMADDSSRTFAFHGFSGIFARFRVDVIDSYCQRSLPTFHGTVCLSVMTSRRSAAQKDWTSKTMDGAVNWETVLELPVAIPKQRTQTRPKLLKAPVTIQFEAPLTENFIHQLSLELVRDWDTLAKALGINHARLQSIKQQNRNLISDKIVTDLLVCWLKRLPRAFDKVKPLIAVLRRCKKWKLANELSIKYRELSRNRLKTAKEIKLKNAISTIVRSPVVCARWRQVLNQLCQKSDLDLDLEQTIQQIQAQYQDETTRCYSALYTWKEETSCPSVFRLVQSLRACDCNVVADTVMSQYTMNK